MAASQWQERNHVIGEQAATRDVNIGEILECTKINAMFAVATGCEVQEWRASKVFGACF